jgi:hypothetical protein
MEQNISDNDQRYLKLAMQVHFLETAFNSSRAAINKRLDNLEATGQVVSSEPVAARPCIHCGASPQPTRNSNGFWYMCSNPACVQYGPIRDSKEEAYRAWNKQNREENR